MTYDEAVAYIHSLEKFGRRPGLESITALLAALGDPQDKLKVVHVAGTNGKGSICYNCASVLKEAGYKVGLYVSPYVVRFNERIQINFEEIPDRALATLAQEVKEKAETLDFVITEFEFVTALAFLYYAREKCDYVVLEVGLGGRLDATNVVKKPCVSIIASISFDHTDVLGDTLQKIAFEKCGIIKDNCPTVLYSRQADGVFETVRAVCAERHSQLTVAKGASLVSMGAGEITYNYGGLTVKSHLWGEHQIHNGAAAIEAMRICGMSDKAIINGLEKTRIPGRLEVVCKKPCIILDAGHNPDGVRAATAAISAYLNEIRAPLVTVMGMCRDKDYAKCIEKTAALSTAFVAVPAETPRRLEPEHIAEIAEECCKSVFCAKSLESGIETGLEKVGESGVLLVCGSFYVISPARKYILENYEKLSD